MATKRYRQLATHRAELDGKRKALVQEGQALNEQADKENRLKSPAEMARGEAILQELDENKAAIDATSKEMEAEDRLAEHERNEISALATQDGMAGQGTVRVRSNTPEFKSMGEFFQAIVARNSSAMASRIPQAELLMQKLDAYQAAASGMSVGVPSDGGYLVRTDWTTAMLDRAREQAVLLPLTRNIPIGADFDSLEYPFIDETSRATGSRFGGVRVYRKAEAATVTASAPTIGKGEVRLEEIMAIAYATERLLRDSTALENILQNAFASEFAFTVDDEIIRGDGVGRCAGFFKVGGAVSPQIVSIAKEANQTADTVVAGNVLKMYAAMPGRLKSGACWIIHPDVMSQLPGMTIGQMPVWLPPGNIVGGLATSPNGMLLGRPVYEAEQCEALGDQGDIFFANMNEYLTVTKGGEGLRAESSMHVKFIYDEMTFRWVYRINGQPTWRTSVTAFKGANKISPFITLDSR